MINKKHIKGLTIMSIALAMTAALTLLLSNTNNVSASYNPQPRNLCSLGIYPYDANATPELGLINELDESTCKSFLTYPGPYKNKPPLETDNPVLQGAENKTQPLVRHDHNYYNDSFSDKYNYYKAFVDKFEITLQPDAYDNIDLDKLHCDTPVPTGYNGNLDGGLKNCDGSAPDLWGGTKVTKIYDNNKKTVTITWDFATQQDLNGDYTGRPVVWGNNDDGFDIKNLTDENNRKLPFSVHLTTEDNDTIWSATTSSRVLLADLAINKNNYPQNATKGCVKNPNPKEDDLSYKQSGWCYLDPPDQFGNIPVEKEQVQTTSQKTFYWFPIGTVGTVWKKAPEDKTFKEPTLEKFASSKSKEGPFVTNLLTVPPSPQGKKIYYKLIFNADPEKLTSAVITDSIGLGSLKATLLPQSAVTPGEIKYDKNMEVFEGNTKLQTCDEVQKTLKEGEDATHCYSGNIGSGNLSLTKINGEIKIQYSGTLQSALTNAVCSDNTKEVCQEKYNNSAHADSIKVFVGEEEQNIRPITSNAINLQIFCQYILTRAAGDIFLETDLSAGVDISKCSKFQSTTGIIITPGDEETPDLVSTGQGSKIFTVGHEICTAGQAGTIDSDLAKLYGSDITGLSSQICEVKLRTGNPWKQQVIVSGIDENKTRASRWGADTTLPKQLNAILNNPQYNDQNVFHISGDTSTGAMSVNEIGAKTFIIEDGDLYIDGNIHYTGTCLKTQLCTVRDIASLAFIVLNGNIYVDKDVTEMSGVFFVQEGTTDGTGRIFSNDGTSTDESASYEKLTVYGSIYGDIDPLFNKRFFAGDPANEDGGIVIRFDERVILNTPPALRDVLNLSQTQVAR